MCVLNVSFLNGKRNITATTHFCASELLEQTNLNHDYFKVTILRIFGFAFLQIMDISER